MCQVVIDLLLGERLHHHGTAQPYTRSLLQIVRTATTHYQWQQSMLLSIGIDGFDTGCAILGSYLVQPIEQGKDLVRIHPCLTEVAWHLVRAIEFLPQPVG